jgi:anti-anti-sigma factor
METNVKLSGDIVVVELKGRLDLESAVPFRKTCLEKLVSKPVVFDLKNLNFVGSLGLKDFVETLDSMAQKSPSGVRFSGASSEFRWLFEANGFARHHFFENTETAIQSLCSSSS